MGRTFNAICEFCGGGCYKRSKDLKKKFVFCSTPCYSSWRKKINNKYKICPICNNKFHFEKREQKFCSVKCAASRPRSQKWNGRGKNFKYKLKELLLEKGWDGSCMVLNCSYNRTTDIHRLIPGKEGGEYTLENIFALCPNHHAEEHRKIIKLKKIGDMELISEEWSSG